MTDEETLAEIERQEKRHPAEGMLSGQRRALREVAIDGAGMGK